MRFQQLADMVKSDMVDSSRASHAGTLRKGYQRMKDNQPVKKLVVSALIIGVFLVYCLSYNRSNLAAPGGPSSAPTTPSNGTAAPGAQYKDGTYNGSVADAQWGYVQVQVTIKNGKITTVTFLQYPSDRERSVMINQYADPQLVSEAIQAQSAQVDVITGATDSSVAFMQSLSDALSQAQA
jgi:uncharacterized protein with FMN-binding domain